MLENIKLMLRVIFRPEPEPNHDVAIARLRELVNGLDERLDQVFHCPQCKARWSAIPVEDGQILCARCGVYTPKSRVKWEEPDDAI